MKINQCGLLWDHWLPVISDLLVTCCLVVNEAVLPFFTPVTALSTRVLIIRLVDRQHRVQNGQQREIKCN